MINLLPPKEKGNILFERKKRIITLIWIFVLVCLVFFILILFGIRFCVQDQIKSQEANLKRLESKAQEIGVQNIQEEVKSINSLLREINSFYEKRILLEGILEKVSNTLLERMHLTNLSVSFIVEEKEKRILKISLSGFSPNRETLFEFRKKLEEETLFKDVYFPPANWIKPNDIDFFVTFNIDLVE